MVITMASYALQMPPWVAHAKPHGTPCSINIALYFVQVLYVLRSPKSNPADQLQTVLAKQQNTKLWMKNNTFLHNNFLLYSAYNLLIDSW